MAQKIVFVGISGGVDSALSAYLLKKNGYRVVGVFIRTWHPGFLTCNEETERQDAMRVAVFLDIPFLTFDLQKEYKKEVADYMIAEYKAGRTPNPDVMCNKEIKFGAFLKKALSMGADYVATGHYAQVKGPSLKSEAGKGRTLIQSIDPSKDQSYFLWTLRQEQLRKILFPIGHLKKTAVRKLAQKVKLPVAQKKDSQGICFLGKVDLKEFLKHYLKEKKGLVKNTEGKTIGYHSGVVFYTLGERHGFIITEKSPTDRPYYIVAKDFKKNILYVSQNKNLVKNSTDNFLLKISSCSRQSRSQASFSQDFCLTLKNVNWIFEVPKKNKKYTAQIRYHGEFLPCQVRLEKKNKVQIIFEEPILAASGQSCVLYDKEICLGGGIII